MAEGCVGWDLYAPHRTAPHLRVLQLLAGVAEAGVGVVEVLIQIGRREERARCARSGQAGHLSAGSVAARKF